VVNINGGEGAGGHTSKPNRTHPVNKGGGLGYPLDFHASCQKKEWEDETPCGRGSHKKSGPSPNRKMTGETGKEKTIPGTNPSALGKSNQGEGGGEGWAKRKIQPATLPGYKLGQGRAK